MMATSNQRNIVSNEIMEMLDKCIDMACKIRESSYRIHMSNDVKAAGSGPAVKEPRAACFSTVTKDKIITLQEILRDTCETMDEFV